MTTEQKTIPVVEYRTSPGVQPINRRWWLTPDETQVHSNLFEFVKRLRNNQRERLDDNAHYARLYSNKEWAAHSLAIYGASKKVTSRNRLKANLAKACTDTAAAKIAKNRPRTLFLTEDGDHGLQRRAEYLTQYLDGYYDTNDVYEKGVKCFKHGGIYGTGALKVYKENGKIEVENVLISEIEVDELDALYGKPRSLYQVKLMHKETLIAMFPNQASAINSAENLSGAGHSESAADMVSVVEGWHLASGLDTNDGCRSIVISNATLVKEGWEKPYFPFVFFHWTEPLAGFYGEGIPAEVEGYQFEINRTLKKISETHDLFVVPRVLAQDSTRIKSITNETGSITRYSGEKPEFTTPAGLPPQIYSYVKELWQQGFEQTGISQMSATSKKPPGLDSGVALREYNDIETERFVLVGQCYESLFVKLSAIIVDLSRDLFSATEGKKSKVWVKNKDFLKRVDWSDIDIEAEQFVMRAFPTSLLPTQPAARTEKVQEYIAAGWLDREEGMELLDFPDLKQITSTATAAMNYIRHQLDQMLNEGEAQVPNPIMDLNRARRMTTAKIQDAETRGYPPERIDLMYGYLSWIDQFLAAAEPPPAPPAQGSPMPALPPQPMVPEPGVQLAA